MTRPSQISALVLCIGLFVSSIARTTESVDLLIEHATVFVGDGRTFTNASVAIIGNRIHWVGPTDKALFSATTRIDGNEKTVIPGLIDGHVHLMSSTYVLDSLSLEAYQSTILPHWLEAMLLHGVTTIRTLGAPIRESRYFKEKTATGELPGPRIIASGPGLTAPRGHPAATMYTSTPEFSRRFVRTAETADQARAAIAEVIDAGMESPLKLIYHGGDAGHDDYMMMGISIDRLATEALEAAVDEAHARGYIVSAHTNDYEDALTAVLIGVDGLEHGVVSTALPDERLSQAMIERGTFLVSTLRLQGLLHGSNV
ncbi:MAG: amidohydrolase family protein, partial [Pseudomonadales bacterium]